MFDNYTMADICDDLFMFTDALEDILSDEEKETLTKLRARFHELCIEGVNN